MTEHHSVMACHADGIGPCVSEDCPLKGVTRYPQSCPPYYEESIMTQHDFKPGDRVVVNPDHPSNTGEALEVNFLETEKVYTVLAARRLETAHAMVRLDDDGGERFAFRFRLAPAATRETDLAGDGDRVIVVDPSPVHLRPYDFNAGDERKFSREEAIARAQARATMRGCRQQVRPVRVQPGDEKLMPRWLIQDI